MKRAIYGAFFFFCCQAAIAQSLPTPKFNSVTVGGSSISGVGTASGTVAAGNDQRLTGTVFDAGVAAACNGTTDDTNAIGNAAAAGAFRVPGKDTTHCITTYGYTAAPGGFKGPGRIVTSDGNPRAPIYTHLQAQPATGNWTAPNTAYTGDLSQTIAHEHVITGTTTLGVPVGNQYIQIPEASAEILSVYNNSGMNTSVSGNGGRTGVAAKYLKLFQYGQGDLAGYTCFGIMASSLSGATSYLASPAMECFGGDLYAAANGEYIEMLGDMDITDLGYDIASAGEVMNLNRGSANEAIGANWIVRIVQSQGTQPIDVVDRITGPIITGLDFSNATMGYWRLASVSVNSGGSGFAVGDTITVSGGTAITPTVLKVATITGGSGTGPVATVSVVQSGIYTTPPVTSYVPFTLTTSGSGSGANIAGQYDDNSIILLPPTGGCIKPGSLGGITAEASDIYGKLCIDKGGLNFGGANNTRPSAPGSNDVQLGDHHAAQGMYNLQTGAGTYDGARVGVSLQGTGGIALAVGSAQVGSGILEGSGSGTSAIRLTSDGNTASGQNTYSILNNEAFGLRILLQCRDVTTPASSYAWSTALATLLRGSSASTTTLAYATPTTLATNSWAPTISATADTTNGSLNLSVTPPAGNTDTVHCTARIDSAEVQ